MLGMRHLPLILTVCVLTACYGQSEEPAGALIPKRMHVDWRQQGVKSPLVLVEDLEERVSGPHYPEPDRAARLVSQRLRTIEQRLGIRRWDYLVTIPSGCVGKLELIDLSGGEERVIEAYEFNRGRATFIKAALSVALIDDPEDEENACELEVIWSPFYAPTGFGEISFVFAYEQNQVEARYKRGYLAPGDYLLWSYQGGGEGAETAEPGNLPHYELRLYSEADTPVNADVGSGTDGTQIGDATSAP